MSKYRMMDLTRNLRFQIHKSSNETYVAFVENRPTNYDNIGALYYVVAVVLIYGLSIVMMIASHIRRNKQDSQLRSYLKEMAAVRKNNRREKLLEKMTDLASKSNPRQQKVNETSFSETKKNGNDSCLYGRLPTETDDESRDVHLSKNSNSYNSDNDDSVFQFPNDFCVPNTKLDSPATPKFPPSPVTPKYQNSPVTPKILTYSPGTAKYSPSKVSTPKHVRDGKAFFHIQVINENVPL